MGERSGTGLRVTRRRAITYGVGATAAVIVPGLRAAGWPRGTATLSAGAAILEGGRELRHPRVLRSRHGRLHVNLTCRPAIVDMGAPKPVRTYTYDGVVPGYTWELRGGDVLTVDLRNRLPELPHQPMMQMDRPHEWTTTNLHTHGLHVSPSGNGDNVFLEIAPGDRFHYRIPVPEDHPAGIFWYHPHHHGAVTQQVRAGMAGLIIVRGDLDRVPEVRTAQERILVLQSIELGADYELLDPIPDPTKEQAFFPRKNVLYTVNGTLAPTITMHPGEVQRWRLLNAAEGKFLSLKLEGHDLNVLAWDGLTMHAPESAELVMMSAGNRVELLVKAGKPGVYKLMLTPGSSQKPNIPGMPPSISEAESRAFFRARGKAGSASRAMMAPGLQDQPGELEPRAIATLVVRGNGSEMRLPESLPAYDPPIRPIAARRHFEFTVSRDPMKEFLSFGIDGKQFQPDEEPYRAKLGTAEEWTLVNAIDVKLMDHAHVYHIHVNPFRITEINGRTLSTPLWRDTFVLTKRTGDSITFQSNFDDFTGKFVEHCHVVSHEDLGMMGPVEVVR
jgi:FtsP/CotA-like multicopper oxidase with cupredoxin domain